MASIYTSESGEWKLGGFEVLSNVKDDEAVIYVCSSWQTCHIRREKERLMLLTDLRQPGTRLQPVYPP